MNLKRPSSESELEALQKTAYNFACKAQYDEALKICDWLIEEKSTEVAGYRERAAVKEHMGDIHGAIADLQLVVVRAEDEPADFHALGLLLLQNGFTVDAINSFGKAISIGEKTGNHYYTNSSLLFRAEAYLKRADFKDALADVMHLPIGYQTYIPSSGMRSKEQITKEASAALARKHKPN